MSSAGIADELKTWKEILMIWSIKIIRSEPPINTEGLNGPPPLLEGEDPTHCERKGKDLLPQNAISYPRQLHCPRRNNSLLHCRKWLLIQNRIWYPSQPRERKFR